MRITLRFAVVLVVFQFISFYFFYKTVADEIRPQYLRALEESLNDTAAVLSALIEDDLASAGAGSIPYQRLNRIMAASGQKVLLTRIYRIRKQAVTLRVYITDKKGIVLFDSQIPENVGRDFSRWNDVFLTLRGEYGARATRLVKNDPSTSEMHVASPIRAGNAIVGVLTVVKPSNSVSPFIEIAEKRFLISALITFLGTAAVAAFAFFLVTRPVRLLKDYAQRVRRERIPLPRLPRGELKELGRAFEEMRKELEGKDYVERYVQTLVHELKSPLTSISGAAEILGEGVSEAERQRFVRNIQSESQRLRDMLERLLLLAAIEARPVLSRTDDVPASTIVEAVQERLGSALDSKGIQLQCTIKDPGMSVHGDPVLIVSCLSQLVENSADFSPPQAAIELEVARSGNGVLLTVLDRGTGIPAYALDRVFERFYSLPRPATGRKSSGLGLSFVKEAADLHHGWVKVSPRDGGGTRMDLFLPGRAV
ncbi:MAG: two-component system sensor histidine kinase CreC [Spirochaetia bacterium]|nr:two-component system sensor histidine kinase CreC [Spirochaetia bacterium]